MWTNIRRRWHYIMPCSKMSARPSGKLLLTSRANSNIKMGANHDRQKDFPCWVIHGGIGPCLGRQTCTLFPRLSGLDLRRANPCITPGRANLSCRSKSNRADSLAGIPMVGSWVPVTPTPAATTPAATTTTQSFGGRGRDALSRGPI